MAICFHRGALLREKQRETEHRRLLLLTVPAHLKPQRGNSSDHLSAFIRATTRKSFPFLKKKKGISRQPHFPYAAQQRMRCPSPATLGENRNGYETQCQFTANILLLGVPPASAGGTDWFDRGEEDILTHHLMKSDQIAKQIQKRSRVTCTIVMSPSAHSNVPTCQPSQARSPVFPVKLS